MRPRIHSAFTLVELLVVIAIIAVLLALLVPALSSAVYQAKLSACGAHLHGIGTGITNYAFAHNRRYPSRRALSVNLQSWSAGGGAASGQSPLRFVSLYGVLRFSRAGDSGAGVGGVVQTSATADDRPIYAQYMALDLFEDPLCERTGVTDPQTYQPGESVYTSLDLWWDIGFSGGGKMNKVGAKTSWTNPVSGRTQSYTILAADRGVWRSDGVEGFAHSSHPDYAQRLENQTRRSSPALFTREWASLWQNSDFWTNEKYDKSRFDRNYLYADGSTLRVSNIDSAVDRTGSYPCKDPRMEIAPWIDDGADWQIEYQILPKHQ
jgi:prepilin-type N-terminal cleavage/methylation domain-containing protein